MALVKMWGDGRSPTFQMRMYVVATFIEGNLAMFIKITKAHNFLPSNSMSMNFSNRYISMLGNTKCVICFIYESKRLGAT